MQKFVTALALSVLLALSGLPVGGGVIQPAGAARLETAEVSWSMAGANPQRTSWVPEAVNPATSSQFGVEWYRPIEAYIGQHVQLVAARNKVYVSTARGLYALDTASGDVVWRFDTELPLGHSPTVSDNTVYVGGFDKHVYALNADTGSLRWAFAGAKGGFSTNPLVAEGKVLLGGRDGYFYALDQNDGHLIWQYPAANQEPIAPILYSAAYKDGKVFFAANDNYAYALNVSDGQRIWKSGKLPGDGYQAWWPVVYGNHVVFSGALAYVETGDPGTKSIAHVVNPADPYYSQMHGFQYSTDFIKTIQRDDVFHQGEANGSRLGRQFPAGGAGDNTGISWSWKSGKTVVDASKVTQYLEDDGQVRVNRTTGRPWRRGLIVLSISNGAEYTFDSDRDGHPEYAPFLFAGTKSGNRYPPLIIPTQNDSGAVHDVLYAQNFDEYYSGWSISRARLAAWQFGTQYIHPAGGGFAIDEPFANSAGGSILYENLCCDRVGGWLNLETGSGGTFWDYNRTLESIKRDWDQIEPWMASLAPGYDQMWWETSMWAQYPRLWGNYGTTNGIYHNHGIQNPLIPYKGRLFVHRSNAIIALGPHPAAIRRMRQGETPEDYEENIRREYPQVARALLEINAPDQATSSPLTMANVQNNLNAQIAKMLQTGHLRPGYYNGTTGHAEFSNCFDNPGQTLYVLTQAYPYVSAALRGDLEKYIKQHYRQYFEVEMVTSTGYWIRNPRPYDLNVLDGLGQLQPREWMPLPPEVAQDIQGSQASASYTYPQQNIYAMWKYAQTFYSSDQATLQNIYSRAKSKLSTAPPGTTDLRESPWIHNQYIAGYIGFLNLQALAGKAQTDASLRATIESELDRLLTQRSDDFRKDHPWVGENACCGRIHRRSFNVARNFIDLTPELADYLHENALDKLEEAIDEYDRVAPYWVATRYEASFGEFSSDSAYTHPTMFLAKAYILKEPAEQLLKYVDAPIFETGDLFYIQTLVAILDKSSNGPSIHSIVTNLADYPGGRVPRYAKVELTFDVDTVAQNELFPYDAAPPAGLEPGLGITVDALFSPDGWQTTFTQPAFYYQEYEHAVKQGHDWMYPTDGFAWKVRFTPTAVGDWQYRLVAQDASGITQTPAQTFTVVASSDKGFIRVSPRDARYFEFENGELFLGLGYNLTYGQLDWNNPTLTNEARFQELHANGLQLFRTWLSHWGIFSSAWNAWNSPLPERHAQYIPDASLSMEQAYPGSDVAMVLTWNSNPGMFLGFMKQAPAVKRNTTYHVSIRYLIPKELRGPRIQGHPYGLVAKTGGWLTGPGAWPDNVYGFVDPGTGTIVSDYAFKSPAGEYGKPVWSILEGDIRTSQNDFLPFFYLVLENVTNAAGQANGNVAYIDRVDIREDLGDGQYGPNIVSKPWMAQHLYVDQANSYAFDKVVELAEKYDIYLKLVVQEKNEWILNRIDYDGNPIPDDPTCFDGKPGNDPERCPGNQWFYGNWQDTTKVRWLQRAWWRYLQARWGYSTTIHSWELLNEGDPWNGLHYSLAEEFGQYMHQFAPNEHLVTTSFWHSFPGDAFWANPAYPSLDYADLHAYATTATDTAADSQYYSELYGAKQPEGAQKPLIRGETGFSDDVLRDTSGVWLHNFIWAGVNPGGMYEQYWYGQEHIVQPGRGNDLRYHYRAFRNFMDAIPLTNGDYEDARASTSTSDLRVWGQKDLLHDRSHLWLQNKKHTWKNIVDGVPIGAISGTVEVPGFQPGKTYVVEWWDTYQPDKAEQIIDRRTVVAQSNGAISIRVEALSTDIALKINTPDN